MLMLQVALLARTEREESEEKRTMPDRVSNDMLVEQAPDAMAPGIASMTSCTAAWDSGAAG